MQANEQKKEQKKEQGRRPMTITLPSSESSHIYTLLKIDWPVAERVMVKLGALIISCTGGQRVGQGILQTIVERAVRAYGKTLYSGTNQKSPDHVRIGVFTDCLLEETFRFIRSGQISMTGGTAAVPDSIPAQELRQSLYELLVCDSLKRVLKEACFEEAILDGRTLVRN